MSKRTTRRHHARRQLTSLVTATDAGGDGGRLLLASEAQPLVDVAARTIAGLVVPFGPAGYTSGGLLTFSAGKLTLSAPRRVKLLREHDQHDAVGVGRSFEELTAAQVDERMVAAGLDPLGVAGVWGVFDVPEGDNGDRALGEAKAGLRDAFSVGVQLDAGTVKNLRRSQGAPTAAAGALRETSLVSVPAFDDARVAAAAGADLVVSSWAPAPLTPATTTAGAAGTTPEGPTMTPEQIARLAELANKGQLSDAERTELAELSATAAAGSTPPAGDPATPPAPAAQAGAQLATPTAGPAQLPAYAGAAVVTAEPPVYTFSDTSPHSIVTDLLRSALRGDSEAGERVAKFNAQLTAGNVPSVHTFIEAAVATRDNVDGAGTDLPSFFQPSPNRPDLMRAAIDVKRPFISRLDRIPISNAQPFAIPKVGRFEGVGDHTEGTPHRPAGTLTLGGDTMQPKATSGAYEVSRELIDATNPALDRIAAREMLKDYQRQSEGKIVSLLALRAAQAGSTVYGIDTVLDMRRAMLQFVNDDDEAGDLVAVSKTMLEALGLDVDGVERPQLPFVTPVNAVGTMRAGYTGIAIDGVEMFRSARLDAGVGAGSGVLARKDGILWAESSVLQFRFDEVLGPGVVKLALWAYSGAAILDTADVTILSTGAANAVDADPAS